MTGISFSNEIKREEMIFFMKEFLSFSLGKVYSYYGEQGKEKQTIFFVHHLINIQELFETIAFQGGIHPCY